MKNYTSITVASILGYIFLIIATLYMYSNLRSISDLPIWFVVVSFIWAINIVVWSFLAVREILD